MDYLQVFESAGFCLRRSALVMLDASHATNVWMWQRSMTFGSAEEPDTGFTNVRRVREKMQQLVAAGLVTERPYTIVGRGVMNFYQITPAGYEHPARSRRTVAGSREFAPLGILPARTGTTSPAKCGAVARGLIA